MKNRVKQFMQDREMSVGTLAYRMGVHVNTITRWRSNLSDIPATQLYKLSTIFHCTMEDLLEVDNAKTKNRFNM